MNVDEFHQKYNLSRAAVYVGINQGAFPATVLKERKKGEKIVDESYFIRRQQFRAKVFNYVQDMYWYHYQPHYTDSEIAKMMGVSHPALSEGLWQYNNKSILRYKVPKTVWKMFRKMRMVERVCYKRYNPNFNVTEELDKIAELEWQNARKAI